MSAKLHFKINKSKPRESEAWFDNGDKLLFISAEPFGNTLKLELPAESVFLTYINAKDAWDGDDAVTGRAPDHMIKDGFGVVNFTLHSLWPYAGSTLLDASHKQLPLTDFKIELSPNKELIFTFWIPEDGFERETVYIKLTEEERMALYGEKLKNTIDAMCA